MGFLTYTPTIDYTRLINLGAGDPTQTELLPDGITVSNPSLTQAAIDAALVLYQAGSIPLIESENTATTILDPLTLAQAILGDPTALGTVSNQLGVVRPTTTIQNIYAPPVLGAGGTPTTLAEAQTKRTAELETEFVNLMTVGKNIKNFQINTTLHSLQKWRASIDLVVYSGYQDNDAKDANGVWQIVSKRDMSKIMTDGYKHYRNNLTVMHNAIQSVANATTITQASSVAASWV